MWTAIFAFVQSVPALIGGINNFTNKYFDSKVQITAAKIGGDVAVARTLIAASAQEGITGVDRLRVISGSWILALLVVGFAMPWIIYEWKVVVWDTVLASITDGSTAPIKGAVADWAGTIITCLFGSSTVLSAGHMYFNRKGA